MKAIPSLLVICGSCRGVKTGVELMKAFPSLLVICGGVKTGVELMRAFLSLLVICGIRGGIETGGAFIGEPSVWTILSGATIKDISDGFTLDRALIGIGNCLKFLSLTDIGIPNGIVSIVERKTGSLNLFAFIKVDD
jgi:hypothetical protein